MVRFIIAACFISFGVFMFVMSTIGVFKFKYVLNRMHAAAIGDTLGILNVLLGAGIMTGITFATLKIIIIAILFCITSPIASHMLAKMEIASRDEDEKNYEEKYYEGMEEEK